MLAQPSIPVDQLPHSSDGKLLRPAVVWFGEMLDDRVSEYRVFRHRRRYERRYIPLVRDLLLGA